MRYSPTAYSRAWLKYIYFRDWKIQILEMELQIKSAIRYALAVANNPAPPPPELFLKEGGVLSEPGPVPGLPTLGHGDENLPPAGT